MRKLKLISVVASVLCILMLCTACATPKGKISNYLNPDYVPEKAVLKSNSYVSELEGYIMGEHNQYFAIFEKLPDVTEGEVAASYKIFSMTKASVIATFSGADFTFDFDLVDAIPMVIVEQNHVDLTEPENTDTTYMAYDANGTQIVSSKHEFDDPYRFADLVMFNYAAYSVDKKTGALEKQSDVPEFLQLDECDKYNENYFYVMDDGELIVYDREFNLVSTWSAPSYALETNMFVLNDGNVLIQYSYELDTEEKKYDVYESNDGATAKYDLVSLIYKVVKGSVKELELDFVVESVFTNENAQRNEDEGNSRYSEKFENIAYISPIVDKKIDSSADAMDIVIMNNKAKVQKSLKILDDQATMLPIKISEDVYAILLKNGYALVDGKSRVLSILNNTELELTNDYIVGEAAIYNFDLTKAYDLIENDAKVLEIMDESVFVRAETKNGYEIILLRDGEQKTVFTRVDDEIPSKLVFGEIENGFYYIYNTEIGEYTYYNAKGETIISTASKLETIGSTSGDNLLLAEIDETLVPKYFVFVRG